MDPEQLYDAWRADRSRHTAPEGFADQVIDTIKTSAPQPPPAQSIWLTLGRAALATAAGLALILRVAQLFYMFVPSSQ